ncbi:inactive pancreatic lipase-related protein 1-like [Branchiostoma lanceolatum]|uniref:inactive pancreatic lipase-related protein 1-like n=1 Tax=Branchiostoma lanceolatum TaxID=7740 RepID=UPI0034517952
MSHSNPGLGTVSVRVDTRTSTCRNMLSLLALFLTCHVAHGAEVCYGNLGCFSNIAPFWGLNRPLSALPDAPDIIGTKFYLHTRANPTMAQRERLVADSPATFSASHFSSVRPSMMIIHGFTHSAQHDWVQLMVDELLKKEDANVITVEWSEGATLTGSYEQAVANTRVVGAQIVELVNYMAGTYEVSGQNFHLIGHSLGAQIAGYAGDALGNLARITALDAAEPYFDGMDNVVRLDPTDARFVDVIHTDGSPFIGTLGMGTNLPIGHVDFYPNNGMYQPGCHDNIVSTVVATGVGLLTEGYDGAEAALACSHLKALDFFTESINSECPFTAYPCESYEKFKQGFCLSCGTGSCSQMGARARDHYGARGSMYLMTTDGANGKYCAYHYKVQVTSSSPMAQAAGRLYVTFQGPTGITDSMEVTTDNMQLNAGVTYQKTVMSPEDIGDVTMVHVRFARSSSLFDIFSAQYYTLNKVTITAGETQTGYRFCAGDSQIRNGETVTLTAAGGNC